MEEENKPDLVLEIYNDWEKTPISKYCGADLDPKNQAFRRMNGYSEPAIYLKHYLELNTLVPSGPDWNSIINQFIPKPNHVYYGFIRKEFKTGLGEQFTLWQRIS